MRRDLCCDPITTTAAATTAAAGGVTTCSKDGEDCSFTGCCQSTGNKCFRKNEHWSACNATCLPKRVWKDGGWQDATEKTWDCEVLLPHHVAKVPKCKDPKKDGDDCSDSGCCEKKGSICYKKDEHHSSCNASCTPYAKWDNGKWTTTTDLVWDCTVVKPKTLEESAKEHKCRDPTESGLDCTYTGCCKDTGATCFRKNKHWSSCNATCRTNMKWVDGGWAAQKEQVWDCAVVYPPAVPKVECENGVKDGENCLNTGCCSKEGSICWKKTDGWASCMDRCWTNKKWEGGKWVEKDTKIWDCDVITPNSTTSTLSRLYETADEAASSQPSVASWPLLVAIALGVVAGGSLAVFRRPRLHEEVPREDSAEE